jgi:hypothetical protein
MNKLVLSIAAAGALLVTIPALAQQKAPAGKVAVPSGVFFKGQAPNQYLAKDRLIGAKVRGPQNTIIGDVEDLIIDRASNEVVGVVMGTGGFFGAGEKKVGVRLQALRFESKDGKLQVSLPQASKEVLSVLQPYQRSQSRRTLIERAQEKVQELTDKTKDSAGPALEKAQEATKAAYEKAKEATKGAVEATKEAVEKAKGAATPPKQ